MARLSKSRKEMLTAMMKEAIFEAAVSVLSKHGVTGMTMDRVAAEANLAKGSLYNYFHNKDDLIHFLYKRIVDPISQAIEEIVRADMCATEKLRKIFDTLYEHFVKRGGIYGLLVKNEATRDIVAPSKKTGRSRAIKHFTAVLEQGIEEGAFRPLDPKLASRLLLGCANELFEMKSSKPHCLFARQYVDVLLQVFLSGISIDVNKDHSPLEAFQPKSAKKIVTT
ncbi:MAG: TetR/AcrR family transcriptional regulator [Thermoguttaceae bacterium]